MLCLLSEAFLVKLPPFLLWLEVTTTNLLLPELSLLADILPLFLEVKASFSLPMVRNSLTDGLGLHVDFGRS